MRLNAHGGIRHNQGVAGVRGSRICPAESPPKTYGSGRVCRHTLCGTVLSTFNPDEFCGLHDEDEYDIPCDSCGTVLPFTSQFFWQTRGGLMHTCKECQGFKIRRPKLACNFGEV